MYNFPLASPAGGGKLPAVTEVLEQDVALSRPSHPAGGMYGMGGNARAGLA